ncbi:MAG: hypothetical protein HY016_01515 [Nitrosomonadales bacterium]|nr:hypothetical protein [Nitrosomonadales bacterium]
MTNVYLPLRYAGLALEPELREATGIQRDSGRAEQSPYVAEVARQLRTQPRDQGKVGSRSSAEKDRRKISQRVRRQSVLMELRCGRDRRRRHQRGSDIVVHIDEKV